MKLTQAEAEAFMAKVVKDEGGCWLWQGPVQNSGYGQHRFLGGWRLAHRFSYRAFVGEIPRGLTIDHLCFVRTCVNPEHLDPCTQAENNRRRIAKRPQTACATYHPDTEAEWGERGDGRTYCKECNRVRERQRRAAAK